MDSSPSERSAEKYMESQMEAIKIDVLDDRYARTGACVGC